MTADQLRSALEADGWRFGRNPLENTGLDWYAWKRIDGLTDCQCNDKAPILVLTPCDINMRGLAIQSVTFDVTGEVAGGRWLKLKAYSVRMDEAMAAYPRCAELLKAAWNAAAALPAPAEASA